MRCITLLAAVLVICSAAYCQIESQTDPNELASQETQTAETTAETYTAAPPIVLTQQTPPPIQMEQAIRIARAEMERDSYRQAAETTQGAVETTKWYFTSMLTVFAIFITASGLLARHFAYKERTLHKKATAEAEEAAKNAKVYCANAQQWEQQAADSLRQVKDSTEAELEKVRTLANEEIVRIEKRANQSVHKIVDNASKERKISKLWDDAFKLDEEGKYEEAAAKFAEIISIKTDFPEALNNWCFFLCKAAKSKKDDKIVVQAQGVYDKLIALADKHPDKSKIRELLANAGVSLTNTYGVVKKPDQARQIYDQLQTLAERYPAEAILRKEQVKAGVNLGWVYGDAGKPELAHEIYNQLKELAAEHPGELYLGEQQANAGVNLTNGYSKAKMPYEARKIYDEVKEFANRYENKPVLRESQAKTGVNLTEAWYHYGDFAEARVVLEEIEKLADQLPDSADKQETLAEIEELRQKLDTERKEPGEDKQK